MDSDDVAAPVDVLPPGTCIGPYVVLERLGVGGMGVVFLGRDTRLQRRVALKRLLNLESDEYSHVIREARIAARICHPNVATIHDVIEEGSRAFIVMEFVQGESLAHRISRAPLSVKEVVVIGRQLAAGVSAAHTEGVIHGDLKPSNVQLTNDGQAKILDFGIARATRSILPTTTQATDSATSSFVTVDDPPSARGTPPYMSPEQLLGHPTDERSDLYSLGVVLFEMATGRRPYEASNGAQLAIALECPPPRVAEANPLVPASLAAIIERALDLDPHRRFPSASALESALTRVDLNEEPRSETRVPMLWILGIAATAAAIASAGYLYHGNIATPRSSTIHSIAVLPLVNLSHDGSQEYFVDGLTDGLINSLGRLSGLKVTARTSVMPFKGSTKSIAIIARELQVDAVLEGSANLAKDENGGESVRIAVNLIDPQTQTQIWNATVEEALVSVLSLQNEIARRLADEIHLAVTADERRRLASDQRIDPNAYKLYLLGRQEWNKRSVESLRKAVDYFSQAIARDPNYAAAYAGLSDSYVLLVGDFGVLPRIEGAVQTEAAAERALALDPDLAEAHTSLAFANFFLNWQFAVADTHFRRALAVNPNYATAHHWYGNYLSDMGREDEGLAQIRRALEIDPLSPIISRDVAWPLFFSGRYDEAVSHLAMTLGAHPGYLAAERLMARAYGQKGDTAEAVRRFEELKKRNDSARAKCELAWAYALAGRTDDADRELTAILDGPSPGVYQYDVALVYAALGRREMALDALEAAFSARDPTMVNLKHDPRLDTLRSEPRFKHLQESMNFPTKIGVPKV